MNIILIGMPTAGKSTVGVVLAKRLCLDFVDTDLLIQTRQGMRLEEIIRTWGIAAFLDIEKEVCTSLQPSEPPLERSCVIATGGSVIYREETMAHLRQIGTVVYLKVPLDELTARAGDLIQRGVTLEKGQTLADLYAERTPLYEKWADVTADETGLSLEETVEAVFRSLPLSPASGSSASGGAGRG